MRSPDDAAAPPASLRGARVWVTGASSGIGEALVGELARAGARVALTARREEALTALATRVHASGGEALVAAADVADREAVRRATERIESEWGGIDLAVFSAGLYVPVERPALNAEDFTTTFAVNYFGMVYGLEAVLPGMLRRGHGRVAAVSSLVGDLPLPRSAAYGSSKAAVTYLMRTLRFDLRPRGVGVTLIQPGFVKTPMVGGNEFWMPALVEVEDAARQIAKGLAQGKDEISFPRRM
ncbi:MAG TPA: SDR family NAD(P)-dependent oxidoreductase, partial [Chloroflexota bacterium]|nr:SDR family NAD(P)-dependent oxidoreductase [Chloroflexota bacterium]